MSVRFRPLAGQELTDAARRYEARVPGLGDALVAEVLATTSLVAQGERTGVRLGRTRSGEDVRHVVLLGRFPYGLVVLLTGADVVVLAVAHGRRQPGYWRSRLVEPR